MNPEINQSPIDLVSYIKINIDGSNILLDSYNQFAGREENLLY